MTEVTTIQHISNEQEINNNGICWFALAARIVYFWGILEQGKGPFKVLNKTLYMKIDLKLKKFES